MKSFYTLSQEAVKHYKHLFVVRQSDYAVQRQNGRYARVGRPLTDADLDQHLRGIQTYGTYVINEAGLCRYVVFDADSDNGLSMLWQVRARLASEGIMAHLEASRRGGHLWIFFTQPLPAAQARTWLLPWCPVGIEFYPKQDQSTGYGSLIRLPLGVHRLTGKRYPWIGAFSRDGKPVKAATTVKETLTWLEQQEKVDPSHFVSRHRHFVSHLGRAYETSHTREVSQSPRNNIDNPSSPTTAHTLHEWCCQQDPFDLIGRYVELDARGVGLCPFGEHHRRGKDCHPSFKVYRPRSPGRACWHCYTWGKGGNVFNFLCYYYGLDAAMMWQRIQAGGVV